MALRAGLPPIQLWFLRRSLSRPILGSSIAVHMAAVGVAAWVTRHPVPLQFHAPPAQVSHQYAVQYFVLPPVTPKPTVEPTRRPVSRRGRVTPVKQPEDPPTPADAPPASGQSTARSVMIAMELAPDSVVGISPDGMALGPDGARGPDLLARLGFSVPGAAGHVSSLDQRPGLAEGDPEGKRGIRVAQLLTADGTACPSLRRPPTWGKRDLAISVAFVVDQRGLVDPRSLRVVESPNQPQTDFRYYSHIYAVSSTARVDGKLGDIAAAYDSVLADEVLSHVANLLFRPATRDGEPVRSTVLVSCESPEGQ